MKHGVQPRYLNFFGKKIRFTDHRDYSYHKTVGNTTPVTVPIIEYNYDVGLGMSNQDTDGYPFACTAYTQPEIGQDFDRVAYTKPYTYQKELLMSGLAPTANVGIQIPIAMKCPIVYGLQEPTETTDVQAETHRQGPYLNVDQIAGMDWFDSIRLALQQNPNRSLSWFTPWFSEFDQAVGGIVPSIFTGNPDDQSWHNHKVSGEHVIAGVPYLYDKSWQGKGVGDNGWLYFGRETVNSLMEIQSVDIYIRLPVDAATLQTIELTLYETLISYLQMWLKLLHS